MLKVQNKVQNCVQNSKSCEKQAS
ncbi:unnamed protein product [Callosobruchus maculatus]|uniref:Uncharacterized protein n=1 Tax=Callosobruchus maculatus TaxID=64391 RepID=A0A653DPU6_CALMS|nr:unnamed protein product [Callosobruchus maculatus]